MLRYANAFRDITNFQQSFTLQSFPNLPTPATLAV